MKKPKLSLILNIINIIFLIFAAIAMFTGFKFMSTSGDLDAGNINAFQFFTVDSNLLLLICSIIYVIYLWRFIKNHQNTIPKWVLILKTVGTVSVTITFLVTVCFLTFLYGWHLFINSNLFFHVLCPVIAVVVLVMAENSPKLKLKEALWTMVPMIVYSIYYVTNVLIHMENGKVSYSYDFYGFAQGGAISIIISVVLMFGLNFGLSFLFYKINQKQNQ